MKKKSDKYFSSYLFYRFLFSVSPHTHVRTCTLSSLSYMMAKSEDMYGGCQLFHVTICGCQRASRLLSECELYLHNQLAGILAAASTSLAGSTGRSMVSEQAENERKSFLQSKQKCIYLARKKVCSVRLSGYEVQIPKI